MPRKRQSQPVQIWLSDFDRVRLSRAADVTGRSQSDIAREGILAVLAKFEQEQQDHSNQTKLYGGLSNSARSVIILAVQEATSLQHKVVGTEHLLMAASADTKAGSVQLLGKAGASHSIIRAKVESLSPWFIRTFSVSDLPPYSARFIVAIERARAIAKHLRDKVATVNHIVLSLVEQEIGGAYEVLDGIGIDRAELRAAIRRNRSIQKEQSHKLAKSKGKATPKNKRKKPAKGRTTSRARLKKRET